MAKEHEFVVEVTMKVSVRLTPETFHKGFRAEVGEVAVEEARVLAREERWSELVTAVNVVAVEEV